MTVINFVLDAFESTLVMDTPATIPTGTAPTDISADATAVYWVSVDAMKNAFYFQSDSRDISDDNSSDIRYFVNWPANYVLNPCHAHVSDAEIAFFDAQGDIPSNRMLVKHDFIRHIANNLFKTHLAVDLFSNEDELRNDLATKGHDAWLNQIKPVIDAVSPGGTLAHDGYTTNDTSPPDENLCRVLFRQILNAQPDRFYDLDSLKRGNNEFYLPFEDNDSIQFKVVLQAATNQASIIDRVDEPVPDRSYIIKLCIIQTLHENGEYSDGTNVLVNDASDLNNSCVLISAPPEN